MRVGGAGSTAIIQLDGDLLTVRSLGGDPSTAKGVAMAVVSDLVPQSVGR